MSDKQEFEVHNLEIIQAMNADQKLQQLTKDWFTTSLEYEYSYHFTWMGLPIIQYPQDMLAMQELIWRVKPDLIIETGVARGGSIVFYASLLEMMNLEGAEVIGIDIDIRPHNRKAIEEHPMSKRIRLLEGSSVDDMLFAQVKALAASKQRILVTLDSNHTHEHVAAELALYAPLVTSGSYLVVFDTVIADIPANLMTNRPWTPDANPKTAVYEFLKKSDDFEIDTSIQERLLFTVAPDGYLRCIR